MKTLICCIAVLLCVSIDIQAEEEPVILEKEQVTHRDFDDRSLHIDPTVTHDGRTVYIRLVFPCEGLWVTVENEYGLVVFSESPDMSNGELSYTFEIENSESKSYHIEIKLDGVLYWGDFVVRE